MTKLFRNFKIDSDRKVLLFLVVFAIAAYSSGKLYQRWQYFQYSVEERSLAEDHAKTIQRHQFNKEQLEERKESEAAKQRAHDFKILEWKKYESGFSTKDYGTKQGCNGRGQCTPSKKQ